MDGKNQLKGKIIQLEDIGGMGLEVVEESDSLPIPGRLIKTGLFKGMIIADMKDDIKKPRKKKSKGDC